MPVPRDTTPPTPPPESYQRIADEANKHFDRDDITVAWVKDAESYRGISIWVIDRWIWDRLKGRVPASQREGGEG